jgi:hypothetical protein
MAEIQKRGGQAAIAGALLAIAGNALLLAATPTVPHDQVSYPQSTRAFQVGQVFFALTQALMAAGVITLVRSRAVRPNRARRVFGWLAGAGIVLTVPGELLLIPVAGASVDSGPATAATTFYGLAVLLTDAGLIGFGILALRHRRWPAGRRLLPLTLGLFQLLVVTPVALSADFASIAAFVVIAVADLLTAGIGLALVRDPAPDQVPVDHRDVVPGDRFAGPVADLPQRE